VILATTTLPDDTALVDVARSLGVGVFRGSAGDVLARYVGAARTFGVGLVVRATGDNPAVDIGAPGRLVGALERGLADYAWEEGLPYGAAVEAMTVSALERASRLATDHQDREHVTPFIRRHPDAFRQVHLDAPANLRRPDLRVTVDTADDLAHVRRLFQLTSRPEPAVADIIRAADELVRERAA
jgi:spore coat polysaccharide biosynthesis protein SpsF